MKAKAGKKIPLKKQAVRKSLLTMNGSNTLATITKLRAKIIEALKAGRPLSIETGAAEQVDVGALQVLIAAQKMAEANGQKIEIRVAAGSPVANLALACGLIDNAGRALIPEAGRWVSSERQSA